MEKPRLINWNRADLIHYYYEEKKTLQEIGDIYGVSRERIRQVMEGFGLSRYTERGNTKGKQPYTDLGDYLAHHKAKVDCPKLLRRLYPGSRCGECGSNRYLHIHHIRYPATDTKDIQLLCASCHKIKHSKGMTLIRQLELVERQKAGISYRRLAEEYHISTSNVYWILRKIRRGYRTLRGGIDNH